MVDTAVKGKLTAVPMPEVPSFLGGSNLGVTNKSQNKALAAQWIKTFTDSKAMEGLIAKGVLPNSTALLDKAAADAAQAPAANAAKNSWFTPASDKWADVEKATVLPQMLRDILTNKKSVEEGAKWADGEINKILNAS
jgi:N,N'-diacetylchitobiose transport system substrate-binding protein